jgi:hypothetical protein
MRDKPASRNCDKAPHLLVGANGVPNAIDCVPDVVRLSSRPACRRPLLRPARPAAGVAATLTIDALYSRNDNSFVGMLSCAAGQVNH